MNLLDIIKSAINYFTGQKAAITALRAENATARKFDFRGGAHGRNRRAGGWGWRGSVAAVKEALAKGFGVAPELRKPALDDERLAAFWQTLGG